MKQSKRYETPGFVETQQEPGSRGSVLKNLMGIKNKRKMDEIENVALKQAEDYFFSRYDAKHRFKAKDICDMHRVWLGKIYPWAGRYRNIDMTKGIRFAHAKFIPQLMEGFERDYLARYTPCDFVKDDELITALSETHVELVLIHPFREGNGRIARLLTTLMALQAGKPLLDYGTIQEGKGKQDYFKAIRDGQGRNYALMKKIFRVILEKTISRSKEK